MGICNCSKAQLKANMAPIENFDINKYMGLWHEIARLDVSFERGMNNVTANYVLQENGMMRVENSGDKNGKRKIAIGKAKLDKSSLPGRLKVAFFLNFYAPYNIIVLDTDYQYVLVASGKKYLWILARKPQIDNVTLQKILNEAKSKEFDTSKLIFNTNTTN